MDQYAYLGPGFWCEYNLVSGSVHNRIEIPVMPTIRGFEKCAISVSSVSFVNSIRILGRGDFIKIDGSVYMRSRGSITELNPNSFARVLNDLLQYSGVSVLPNGAGIIRFFSVKPFVIQDASYKMRMLLGIDKLPMASTQWHDGTYSITAPRYGDYNSTPIMYLLSNLGVNGNGSGMFVQELGTDVLNGRNIFMRFANNHAPSIPVNYIGGDVKYHASTMVLGQRGWIELVDANLVPVDLLYPLRVSVRVEFAS